MLEEAQDILDAENLAGLGDCGYYSNKQIKACEDKNISVYVLIPKHSDSAIKQGRFGRDQFQYDAENNVYLCPQGNTLTSSKNYFLKVIERLCSIKVKQRPVMNAPYVHNI